MVVGKIVKVRRGDVGKKRKIKGEEGRLGDYKREGEVCRGSRESEFK